MTKINVVGDALLRINDAAFQELCSKFLRNKYSFDSIVQTGAVIGKEKTKQGTPDIAFINPDGYYTFVECTTQNRTSNARSFITKVTNDIKACFDTKKSGVGASKIVRVIICHTSKLELKEIEDFQQLCESYNPNCIFKQYGIDDFSVELEEYPSIVSDYLGINIGTGQLMSITEYIEYYEKPDIKLATPLSNEFLGRQKELSESLDLINTNNILLMTGVSGVGKTKFAIELCKRYVEANNSFKMFCFADNDHDALMDLRARLLNDGNYILLVDDANRASNYDSILYVLREKKKGNLKIIATVRDYALDLVRNKSQEYNYNEIYLESMSKDEIADILKSKSFDIQNDRFIERINSIAKGNLRIAIMCAMVVNREKTLYSLNDVSSLYESYYKDAYEKILNIEQELSLKTLGLISFFGAISKDRVITNKIYEVFSISENDFWTQCKKLNKQEFVNLFEDDVVKISDQTLSTFIFYKVFFDTKILDFKLLIDHFIDSKSLFYNAINDVLAAYDYRGVRSELAQIIESLWSELVSGKEHKGILKVLEIFWFCIENKTLSYLYDYMIKLPEPKVKVFDIYSKPEVIIGNDDAELDILSSFRVLENDKSEKALEMMFMYVRKRPYLANKLASLLNEEWSIHRKDIDNGCYIQHVLIDFLIKKTNEEPENVFYADLFASVSANLLKTEFREFISHGNAFTYYTIFLHLSESTKQLRRKIWDAAERMYESKPTIIHKLLQSAGRGHYDDEKHVWEFDSSIVIPILYKLNYEDYGACRAAHKYLNILDSAGVSYNKSIREIASNRLFNLNYILKKQIDKYINFEENELHRKRLLNDYCKNFTYEDYVQLFEDVKEIKELTQKKYEYDYPLTLIVEEIINKDFSLFMRLYSFILSNYPDYLVEMRLLNVYFQSVDTSKYRAIYDCIKYNATAHNSWLKAFHDTVPQQYILDSGYGIEFLDNLYATITSATTMSGLEYIVEKYSIIEDKKVIRKKIIDILFKNDTIDADGKIIEEAINDGADIDKCKTIYFRYKDRDYHYDYDNKIFIRFLKNDPNFIIEYLCTLHDDHRIIYDYHEDFSCIWNLENSEKIIMEVISYFNNTKHYLRGDELVPLFFMNLDNNQREKAMLFVGKLINSKDKDLSQTAFAIISAVFSEKRCDFIKQFLSLNQDYESFRELDLLPNSESWTGSRIPLIQNSITEYVKILETIRSMNMGVKLIKHEEYIELCIKYCEKDIRQESKSEFMERHRT